jgi:hypothetical protein
MLDIDLFADRLTAVRADEMIVMVSFSADLEPLAGFDRLLAICTGHLLGRDTGCQDN